MNEKEMVADSNDQDMNPIEDQPILEDGTTMEIIGRFLGIAFARCLKLYYKTCVWSLKAAVLAGIVLGIFYYQTIIAGLRQGNLLDRLREHTFGPSQLKENPDGPGGIDSQAPPPDDHHVVVVTAPPVSVQQPEGSSEKQSLQMIPMKRHAALTGNPAAPAPGLPAQDNSAPPAKLQSTSRPSAIASAPNKTESDDPGSTADSNSDYSRAAAIRAISRWSRFYRIEFELAMAVAKYESNLEPLRTRFEPDYYRCYVLGRGGCKKINVPQAWKAMLKDESGRKMLATSWGLFQLMPDTAVRVASKEGILDKIQTIPELFDVDLNARIGIAYLKQCMDSNDTFEQVGKCYNGSQSTDWWRKVSKQYVQFLRKDTGRPPN